VILPTEIKVTSYHILILQSTPSVQKIYVCRQTLKLHHDNVNIVFIVISRLGLHVSKHVILRLVTNNYISTWTIERINNQQISHKIRTSSNSSLSCLIYIYPILFVLIFRANIMIQTDCYHTPITITWLQTIRAPEKHENLGELYYIYDVNYYDVTPDYQYCCLFVDAWCFLT